MPDEKGLETDEEARERVAAVRATQIFGDTPTDPTIGDVVVPAHDEEAGNAAAAAVAADADDEDGDAADLSQGEAKRQHEALSAQDVNEGAEDRDDDGEAVVGDDSGDASDEADLTAGEKVEKIKAASSVEEVDALAEGDEHVTVKRAADKKREELSE